MSDLDYRQGYFHALADLAGWIGNPAHPLDQKLCKVKYLCKAIDYIIANLDEFMRCPDGVEFEWEIVKGKMVIK